MQAPSPDPRDRPPVHPPVHPAIRLVRAIPGVHTAVVPPAMDHLRDRVRDLLAPRRAALDAAGDARAAARGALDELRRAVHALERDLAALDDDLSLYGRPFSADMTMDQAWRRHPGARRVFARHHLPACDGCAVRFDETLEEAAAAYGLELGPLLAELSALLPPPVAHPDRAVD